LDELITPDSRYIDQGQPNLTTPVAMLSVWSSGMDWRRSNTQRKTES
jgi:hypothetical protein